VPGFNFLIRDDFNVMYPDVIFCTGGRWGTRHETSGAIEVGKILVLNEGGGGTTDSLIRDIREGSIKKNTGAEFYIATPDNLEEQLKGAIQKARERWEMEGRTKNRFTGIIDILEAQMKCKE